MFSSNEWLAYFESNRSQRVVIDWSQPMAIPPPLLTALIPSLQRFQVGERGDGRHLRTTARRLGDPAYSNSIALFVAEEQDHARLLAQVLRSLDAPLLRWHWSDVCFTLLRRLLGLRWEVLVLMIAELIGKRYYQALRDGVPDSPLHAVFGQIVRDEVGHIAFHTAFLQQAFVGLPAPARLTAHAAWRLLFRCVCLVVARDHGAALAAVGLPPAAFRAECGWLIDAVATRVFTPCLNVFIY
jgi:hypothetical protein